ncbi:MAG: AAA family ATPase [Alphaproteobacteria bacterium]|nr:AAA family ATPase [Alphaproteobacteria bacterium]
MIIECAGLPGAGKTTVCNHVAVAHGGKGSVPLIAMRFDSAFLSAAWSIAALCLGARPFRLERLKRGFNLAVFLRHYRDRRKTILFDQGIVQKIWSILADAENYSGQGLAEVMAALKPSAPDVVVWLETPLAEAVGRMARRQGGRSRYDELGEDEARDILALRAALLRRIAEDFCAVTGARMVQLDGSCEPASNAAQIDTLFRSRG